MPAQVKRQRRSTSQPPNLPDTKDYADSHGLQLHSIPEVDDDDDTYNSYDDNDPGLSFQPLFPDESRVKDFFTALSSGPSTYSDSAELRDVNEDASGTDDEDFTKDLNNVSDGSQTDLDGSESELEGSDDAFLAPHLPAPPVNKRPAKPSSTAKIKSSRPAQPNLKPLYDPQTCRKYFHDDNDRVFSTLVF